MSLTVTAASGDASRARTSCSFLASRALELNAIDIGKARARATGQCAVPREGRGAGRLKDDRSSDVVSLMAILSETTLFG